MKIDQLKLAQMVARTARKYRTGAIILAAGNSTRMGGKINKQLEPVCNIPVLAHTLMAYQRCKLIEEIVVVTRPQDFEAVLEIAKQYGISKLRHIAAGGSTRQESAKNGMNKLSPVIRYVAIADGARCLITPQQIAKVCLRAYRYQAASAAHQISDTVKRTNAVGMVKETVDRNNLWQAQTPQIFHASLYTAALIRAEDDGFKVTDDNSLIEHLGYQVRMVECGRENIKITTKEDLPMAEAILSYRSAKQ
jgi:2-C-methyl-D-erythritol 4-phosphate cytidylyltransferase